jgi:hypothetical protein
VLDIRLIPKARVSFSGVRFPTVFKHSFFLASYGSVASFEKYEDENGLVYEIAGKDSQDGSVHAGDLMAIVYGPSHRAYLALTGCDL